MKLHFLSDVHLEVGKWPKADDPNRIAADVSVLAGDIGTGLMGLEWALTFKRPVVYVMGNHEFWDKSTMESVWASARKLVAGTNVHLLENQAVVIDGVRFLGCTLWTDFALFGEAARIQMMNRCHNDMNDYRRICIDNKNGGSMFLLPRNTLALHQASREFLVGEVGKRGDWRKTVVVTHHAPSALSLADGEAVWNREAACASHLDHLAGVPDLWVHGHTHVRADYRVAGAGRVVSNPRGYRGFDEVADFKPGLVLEI